MSPKGTPADVVIAGRDVRFDVSAVKKGHWLGGDPVGTAVFNALSARLCRNFKSKSRTRIIDC